MWLDNVTINGLVYAEVGIQIQYVNNLVINGALVARDDIMFTNVNNITVNYDPTLDPDYFSGGDSGNAVVVSWQGRYTT